MTYVKLCGMSREADIDAALTAGANMLGFIVNFPPSHRSIDEQRLKTLVNYVREQDVAHTAPAAHVAQAVGATQTAQTMHATQATQTSQAAHATQTAQTAHATQTVGVFVDEDARRIAQIVAEVELDAVQLHGHEDTAFIEQLRKLLPASVRIIQAVRLHAPDDACRAQESAADLVLLDSGQGSGQRFDWSLAQGVSRPFLLAGGLNPDNVAAAIAQVHPWGVDISSGIETDHIKDANKMRAVLAAVRAADKTENTPSNANAQANAQTRTQTSTLANAQVSAQTNVQANTQTSTQSHTQ